ncbi:MAG: HD domain-containing protein [Desulfuromonadaceae bacterium]|nr:HD domain-containing protein [Desulfuromonadaceae bacterium]MDD2856889.1 HD domain-containing protein [Desulfuromonadaceae bacterium]
MSDNNYIHDFIRHLLSATANAALYGTEHPQVKRLSERAFSSLAAMLQTRAELTILVVENELVIDGQPQDTSLFFNRFTHILKSQRIGTLKVLAGVAKPEVDLLIKGLSGNIDSSNIMSSEHIHLGNVDIRTSDTTNDANEYRSHHHKISLPEMPKEELARFMEIYETVKNKHKIQINGVFDVVSGFIDVFRQEGKPLLAMAALRDRDEYTFTHSTNVCVLNLAQAMALGIEGQLLNDIGVAAMLHDIGKLFIPEEILTKKDQLDKEEFEIMREHPVKGARHLLETPGVPRVAVITAYEHHIKYNLSGYPKVDSNWQMNLCSNMTTISDFFDALRTRRPYREPVSLPEIASMMDSMAGTDLHPALTRNFLKIIAGLVETIDQRYI